MASSRTLFLFSLFLLFSLSTAKSILRPRALWLAVIKDFSSNQYITQIGQRTPLAPVSLILDLGGQFLWVDCNSNYVSSSYRPVRCGSPQCTLARGGGCGTCNSPPKPNCNNNTCIHTPDNSVTGTATSGELAQDVVYILSTNGRNPGRVVSVPNFIFTCSPTFLLKGLAGDAKGMAGLGRTNIALPSQFSSSLGFAKKFAICLSSNTGSNGVMFFGDGPYVLHPNVDVSKSLTYTPLIKNPVSTASAHLQGEPSSEYFIGVTSINVNGKPVPLNASLLKINKKGFGGTKLSTVNPYTVMERSIYRAVTEAFTRELAHLPRVRAVAPFGVCYSAASIRSTRVGPAVPAVDLVLQAKNVFWRMFGANSMVEAKRDVLCLGFVDGGVNPRTSIVIGGHQLDDNLLQFDLERSRLGFSSSLLLRQTNCANFNFTPVA